MTGAEPFGFTSLAAALALVAVALLLSWWQRLDVERDIGLACVRAFVQLMAVGYIIHLILQTDRPLYVALTLAAMLLFAVITSARRARGLPGAWTLAAASIGVASMATLAVMLVLGIIPAGARYVIPIGGMLIGNCMNVASVTAVRLLEDAADRRPQIEASLALGASPRQSTATLARRSVRLAMVPVIDSTKTTGLVFLPGLQDLLPPRRATVPATDDGPARDVELPAGFTDDLTVVSLYRRFQRTLRDGTFAPGPLPLPGA